LGLALRFGGRLSASTTPIRPQVSRMIPGSMIPHIVDAVGDIQMSSVAAVGGGSINQCLKFETIDGRACFLKFNNASHSGMFEAERDGLDALRNADAIRVPDVITSGQTDEQAYLLLEFIEFGGRQISAGKRLGALLARQHRCQGDSFGWHRNNTIGSTPQKNTQSADWIEFFGHFRLRFQIELAASNGFGELQARANKLLQLLPVFFEDYHPDCCLLHGDLWSGNWSATPAGEPVIYDPAVYYGDREADIAMTLLFGGFGSEFYAAYDNAWPLDPGFDNRRELYNLYHVFNHLNLFGESYLHQASGILDRLISQAG
jgi:protein-ribulosamine 3-kinase